MLKFKTLSDANDFAKELGHDVIFEDLATVDVFEFHSDALADRIQRRTKLKDMVKSKNTKLQFASDFSRDKLSKSLVKFNQTAAGKRLRQRVQQLRKDGRYNKFETLQVLNNVQGALMQETRYNRDLLEEVHTELCVERLLSLTSPFIQSILEDELKNEEICVLINVGELAESIDLMLNIEEGVVGAIQIQWDQEDDDELTAETSITLEDDLEVPKVPEIGEDFDLEEMSDMTESYLSDNEIFENIDSSHGQTSNKKFQTVTDGKLRPGILGVYTGPAFFLNSISRNKRFYSENVWRKAVADPEFVDRMNRRVMYGGIGHDVKINEEALRTGMISHIVSKVEIKSDGIGYATYEVFDTPSGQRLNTYLSAGSGLKTSTRAYGKPVRGSANRPEGLPRGIEVVDEDNFSFVGLDFVIDPGFMGSETT